MPQVVEVRGLSRAEADEQAANFGIDGVPVEITEESDGTFTVRATYPDGVFVPGAVQVPGPAADANAPASAGQAGGGANPPSGGADVGAASGATTVVAADGSFSLKGLSRATADEEAAFFRDSGATVDIVAEGADLFTVRIAAPAAQAPAPAAPPAAPNAPDLDGYVFSIDRIRTELRPGRGFERTVSRYQAYFNRAPVAGIFGMAVERQGPGDNSPTGVNAHRRIEAGKYPLFTHAGANNRYRTIGYPSPGALSKRPWPCIGVENTGSRAGILIHCASGYLMSIGCINLAANVVNAQTDLVFSDSWTRVTGLIDSIRTHLGGSFPASNNVRLPNTWLVIRE